MNVQNKKKNGFKVFFIVLLLLAITGIALCSAGLAGLYKNGSFDFSALNLSIGVNGKYEYTDYEYIADPALIDEITLDFDNRSITVLESTGEYSGKIALVCRTSQYDHIEESENGRALTIRQNHSEFSFINFDLAAVFSHGDIDRVILYIPVDYIGSLDIKTSNASIDCKSFELLRDVSFVSSNGKITAEGLTLKTLYAKTSNSKINLKDIISDSVTADTSNGKITAESVRAHDKLSLDTSNASISVEDIDSNDIYLKSSNGKISGTVAGSAADFTVCSDTSNGDDSLQNIGGSGYKKLEVKTSNASIDIGFANK